MALAVGTTPPPPAWSVTKFRPTLYTFYIKRYHYHVVVLTRFGVNIVVVLVVVEKVLEPLLPEEVLLVWLRCATFARSGLSVLVSI